MRSKISMLFLLFLMAFPATAEENLKPWQEQAKRMISKEFPRAKDVGWPNGTTSLWIFMYTPKRYFSYETVTTNWICPLLYNAGMPKDNFVIVTYWSFEGSGVGKSRILAKVPCE